MAKVRAAWVQVQQPGRPTGEARAVLETLAARGQPTQTGSLKQLQRGRVALDPEVLVVGDHDVMRAAFKQLGVGGPWLSDYPRGVEPFLRRSVRPSTLAQARAEVDDSGRACFIKPREARKRFTGFVYAPGDDSFAFAGASGSTAVWCSDPVEFGDEYRAYVCGNGVVGVTAYAGATPGDTAEVEDFTGAVLRALQAEGTAVAGFAIDVGRTPQGLAVVECNDGFALGRYDGMPPEPYVDLLVARWVELLAAC